METILSKSTRIFFSILLGAIQVVNMIFGNIIVYETTEKISFDWNALIKNKLFWIVLIIQLVYQCIIYNINKSVSKNDKILEKAISENSAELIKFATKTAIRGDFESSEKLLDVLDKIRKRRNR